MKKQVTICDRCGKEINQSNKFEINQPHLLENKIYDLCDSCSQFIEQVIQNPQLILTQPYPTDHYWIRQDTDKMFLYDPNNGPFYNTLTCLGDHNARCFAGTDTNRMSGKNPNLSNIPSISIP